jgi:hypothetical protein
MLGGVAHREHELGGRVLRAMRWGDVKPGIGQHTYPDEGAHTVCTLPEGIAL